MPPKKLDWLRETLSRAEHPARRRAFASGGPAPPRLFRKPRWHRQVDLLDSDNAIAPDRSSSFILGLAAASPALNFNIEVKAGFVIDLSGHDRPPMRVSSTDGRIIRIGGRDETIPV
jgi:hypothetical protein